MATKKANTEVKKISVSEFVEGYLKISPKVQGTAGRQQYVKNAKVVDYIPFKDKLATVTRIVKATTQDSDGNFRQSSPIKYILLVTEVIGAYTTIQFRQGLDLYEDYDLLNQNGLIEELIDAIPEKEYAEFETLTSMVQDDLVANKFESHVFFNDLVMATVKELEKVIEKVGPDVLQALVANDKATNE